MSSNISLQRIYIKDRVIFPNMLFSVTIKDENNIKILKDAYDKNSYIFIFLKTVSKSYQIGTISSILGLSKVKDGYLVLLYGAEKVLEIEQKGDYSLVTKMQAEQDVISGDKLEFKMTYNRVIEILKKYQDLSKKEILNKEIQDLISQLNAKSVINIIITKLNMNPDLAQEIYEMNDVLSKLNRIYFAILDQIRIIVNLSEYRDLPNEIKDILIFMNTAPEVDDSLLTLGFVINHYLKHKHLNLKETKAIQELRNSLLVNLNNDILN